MTQQTQFYSFNVEDFSFALRGFHDRAIGIVGPFVLHLSIQPERALQDQERDAQFPRAIPLLQTAVALAPENGDARVALGVALVRHGKVDDAVAQLREAIAVSPTNPWAFRNLGGIMLRQGKATEAEPHLRRAVELNPADPAARSGLGKSFTVTSTITPSNPSEPVISASRS